MTDRLSKLALLPPPANTPWTGAPADALAGEIVRRGGAAIQIDSPLFWYDPPWHLMSTESADSLAVVVGERGVTVAALRSEVASPEEESGFHESGSVERPDPLSRLVPYRPERYGLCDRDFDGASIIDLRLTMHRDETGRFAYSPEQIARWEATPEDQPLAGGSWVPAATFPPDVDSIEHLSAKVDQIRVLSPSAAAFVSIGAYRLREEVPAIIAAKPDGMVVRCDDLELDGFELARLTRSVRQMAAQGGVADLPIWIVPGNISPADAVKLIGLGATAVAIDDWCEEIIAELDSQHESSSRYSSRGGPTEQQLQELAEDHLDERLEQVSGLHNSMAYSSPAQRVGSFDATWARALGIPSLSSSFEPET